MFAVIFEVRPKNGQFERYLELARHLRSELEKIDGFIENERFGSKLDAGRVLSLSIWRDEKALIRWRTHGMHHEVQLKGRFEVFDDYHLRVGEIVSDSSVPDDQSLPQLRFDETEAGAAKAVIICEVSQATGVAGTWQNLAASLGFPESGTIDQEVFESIYTPGKLLLLSSWKDAASAEHWTPPKPALEQLRFRRVRIIRDYGKFDRTEAPQYFPAADTVARLGSRD